MKVLTGTALVASAAAGTALLGVPLLASEAFTSPSTAAARHQQQQVAYRNDAMSSVSALFAERRDDANNNNDYFQDSPRRGRGQQGGRRRSVDQAFQDLQDEVVRQERSRRFQRGSSSGGRNCAPSPFVSGPFDPFFSVSSFDPEAVRKQKEWANRAFDFVTGLSRDFSPSSDEAKRSEEEIRQVREYVNRLYDGFAASSDTSDRLDDAAGGADNSNMKNTYSPRFEIRETADAYLFALDVPGVPKSDVDITLQEKVVGPEPIVYLVVEGVRKRAAETTTQEQEEPPAQNQDDEAVAPAAAGETFSKRFLLNDDADTEKISASLENGVLTVSVAKIMPKKTDGDDVEEEDEKSIRRIPVN